MTETSKILEAAEDKYGWKSSYNNRCGVCTTIVGQVALTKPGYRPILIGVRCAEKEGLVFDASKSTYKTLTATKAAIKK